MANLSIDRGMDANPRRSAFLIRQSNLFFNSIKFGWSQASSQGSRLGLLADRRQLSARVIHLNVLTFGQSSWLGRRHWSCSKRFPKVCFDRVSRCLFFSLAYISLIFGQASLQAGLSWNTECKLHTENHIPLTVTLVFSNWASTLLFVSWPFNDILRLPYQSTYPGEEAKYFIQKLKYTWESYSHFLRAEMPCIKAITSRFFR